MGRADGLVLQVYGVGVAVGGGPESDVSAGLVSGGEGDVLNRDSGARPDYYPDYYNYCADSPACAWMVLD